MTELTSSRADDGADRLAPRRPRAWPSLAERIDQTRSACVEALAAPDIAGAEDFLARRGISVDARAELLRAAVRPQAGQAELLALRDALAAERGLASDGGALERALLLRAALSALDRLPALPVDDSVMHLFCKEFAFYAQPADFARASFALGHVQFVAMGKIVLLERFPAGGSHWEVSGFPRSWLLKVTRRFLPHTLRFLALETRGFRPFFVGHLAGTRHRLPCLIERECRVAFYRSAIAMEKQPSILGGMAGSWLHSVETHRVSPHLAFLNRPYMEAGGLYTELGPAHESDGFMDGSPERAAMYRAGKYKPAFGVVIVSRAQVIAWKRAHPELESQLRVR